MSTTAPVAQQTVEDVEAIKAFVEESNASLETLETQLIALESEPTNLALVDEAFRSLHSMKGGAGFFGLEGIATFVHRFESVLDGMRKGSVRVCDAAVSLLLKALDELKKILADTGAALRPLPLSDEQLALASSLEGLALGCGTQPETAPCIERGSTTTVVTELRPKSKTIKVAEETIDGFMGYIGDLIISSELFRHLLNQLDGQKVAVELLREFKNAILAFNTLSHDLQKSLMEIRKVPLSQLLSKSPRMVRELTRQLGKEAELKIAGEELMIDKSLIELLEDPLVHMVRNAIDHGLETSDVREKAGKPRAGTISIEGSVDRKFVTLKISDDGKGIDPERLKQAAIKKGLITTEAAARLTEREALNLVFLPGFSSAETVSQVSGRGVGMDVVYTNTKRANGTIDIDTEIGKGTTFTIRVPLSMTVVVIPALLVLVTGEVYALPLEAVREVARASTADIHSVQQSAELLRLREQTLPLLRLSKLLRATGAPGGTDAREESHIVVEADGRRYALACDRLLGIQQVVVKGLDDTFAGNALINGSVILGNGKVGLVLDVKGILKEVNKCQAAA